MFKRLGQVLLIVAALAASGTHWVLLQSIAWTGMLASNLQTSSVTEAVQHTFDGKHPCCLCKQIAAGKQAEKKQDYSDSLKRLEFVRGVSVIAFVAPNHFILLPDQSFTAHLMAHEPLLPPPRVA